MKTKIENCLAVALLVGSTAVAARISDYQSVTEELLRSPPNGDWLSWRGTQAGWGYSALDQINSENVGQLQLIWSWAMDDTGAGEAAPLIHDGVMFLPGPRGVIQADRKSVV